MAQVVRTELLHALDRRHDDLVRQLDELIARIEETLARSGAASPYASIITLMWAATLSESAARS